MMLQTDAETLDAWQVLAHCPRLAWCRNAQDTLRTGRGVLDRGGSACCEKGTADEIEHVFFLFFFFYPGRDQR